MGFHGISWKKRVIESIDKKKKENKKREEQKKKEEWRRRGEGRERKVVQVGNGEHLHHFSPFFRLKV